MEYRREASRKGPRVAISRVISAVMALLVLTIGTVAGGPGISFRSYQCKTFHTIRTIRIPENCVDHAESPEVCDVCPTPHSVTEQSQSYFPTPDLPKFNGAISQQSLRAPPQS